MGPQIQAACQVGLMGSACTFTNTGDQSGSACATVIVTSSTGNVAESGSVCSGDLASQSSSQVGVVFIGKQPATFCGDWKDCKMDVKMGEVQDTSTVGALVRWAPVLAPVLLIVALYTWMRRKAKESPGPAARS